MKVYRYMSSEEFHMMSTGMDMIPRTYRHLAKTDSTGFCFLPETVVLHELGCGETAHEYAMSAVECYSFLNGIVSRDVLVEFEAPDDFFRVSEGVYADPYGGLDDYVWISELCCDRYNRDVLVPTRYAIPDRHSDIPWYTFY